MKISNKLVRNSILYSIIFQIVIGIIAVPALFFKLDGDDTILQTTLLLETVVQIIEATFYIFIAYFSTAIIQITPLRYIDWFITTPTMLISTVMFMRYKQYKENQQKITARQFFNDDKDLIIKIVASNFIMLLFGYLGETNVINNILAVLIGSVFFLYTFYTIFVNYAMHTVTGYRLFSFVFIIWYLYAVAALMGTNLKNVMYNALDIVSKNFYGLFLAYIIWSLRK